MFQIVCNTYSKLASDKTSNAAGDQKFQQVCHSIQDFYLFSALSIRPEINSLDVYCNSYIDAPGMIGSSTFMYVIHRGYYMAARRYEISLRVLKNISQVSAASE